MKTVGIIPVRSGSKRFPGKNFSKFNETTLIENTVDKLLKAGIDYIVISTDNKMLFNQFELGTSIFSNPKVICIRRPDEISQDTSDTKEAMLDVIDKIKPTTLDEDYIIILAQVTSPNWSPHSLSYALHRLEEKKVDSVISVSPNYQPNGCFYIIRKSTFIDKKNIFLPNMYLVKFDWESSIDIDYEYQLYIAQALSRNSYDE